MNISWQIIGTIAIKIVIVSALALLAFLAIRFMNKWLYRKIKHWSLRLFIFTKTTYNRIMTKLALSVIRRCSTASVIDTVLALYCSFYEKKCQDITSWALPEDDFPKGASELSEMYRWIKLVRKENFTELEHLDFDEEKQSFLYWGASYKTFKHKIHDGELRIEPNNDCEYANISLRFKNRKNEVVNDLYDMDTKKVIWIIARRRYFTI